jgi:hypothetical protein
MKREQWFIWLAVVVVLAVILAAISFHMGWWLEVWAAGKSPAPPPTPHGHILPVL